ncbi:MAG: MBL fold metallo-hydrolase [Firmicutes bacterium]|nr:MBL fold metallo-hydrolase [Bacillota bacterium]
MNILVKALVIVGLVFVVVNIALIGRFYLGKQSIEVSNREMTQHKIDLETVDRLTVYPIVDLLAKGENLKTEPGTSFLVATESDNILFDVGYNVKQEEVSPLLYNLKQLDISLDDINALAISHNHADHVGGLCFKDNRVELTKGFVDLHGKSIFTPVPMTCDTAVAKTVEKPLSIGTGVASTGPLAEQMFIPGRLNEQSLLVNVKEKGLVLISGCGHPGIIRMVKAAQKITGIPVYAVVGGLHLYYTQPKAGFWGNIFGSSKLYCGTPSREEVVNIVNELKKLGVKKAYISPHDADQPTLEIFADRFGKDYEPLTVGNSVTF